MFTNYFNNELKFGHIFFSKLIYFKLVIQMRKRIKINMFVAILKRQRKKVKITFFFIHFGTGILCF